MATNLLTVRHAAEQLVMSSHMVYYLAACGGPSSDGSALGVA